MPESAWPLPDRMGAPSRRVGSVWRATTSAATALSYGVLSRAGVGPHAAGREQRELGLSPQASAELPAWPPRTGRAVRIAERPGTSPAGRWMSQLVPSRATEWRSTRARRLLTISQPSPSGSRRQSCYGSGCRTWATRVGAHLCETIRRRESASPKTLAPRTGPNDARNEGPSGADGADQSETA